MKQEGNRHCLPLVLSDTVLGLQIFVMITLLFSLLNRLACVVFFLEK